MTRASLLRTDCALRPTRLAQGWPNAEPWIRDVRACAVRPCEDIRRRLAFAPPSRRCARTAGAASAARRRAFPPVLNSARPDAPGLTFFGAEADPRASALPTPITRSRVSPASACRAAGCVRVVRRRGSRISVAVRVRRGRDRDDRRDAAAIPAAATDALPIARDRCGTSVGFRPSRIARRRTRAFFPPTSACAAPAIGGRSPRRSCSEPAAPPGRPSRPPHCMACSS